MWHKLGLILIIKIWDRGCYLSLDLDFEKFSDMEVMDDE
jgi:hypothetical protein